ncbi:thioredoxin domain-containing protein, partial [Candidatus Roizmanbacteria bacterium]|nr:thioredoxin domain-containing protein [Candidatus Roizmanbacteria bacterium]
KIKDVETKFESYAKDLKLDVDKFKKDLNSKEAKEKVSADVLSGNNAAVNATPTFYLNGQKLDSVRSFDEFIKLLQNI